MKEATIFLTLLKNGLDEFCLLLNFDLLLLLSTIWRCFGDPLCIKFREPYVPLFVGAASSPFTVRFVQLQHMIPVRSIIVLKLAAMM